MAIFEIDRIIITAFLSIVAILITTGISIIKMVNDKENKTSEFRQEWINSVRACISDLTAKIIALTSSQEYHARLANEQSSLSKDNGEDSKQKLNMIIETRKRVDEEYSKHKHDLHQSYAFLKLHFKPNEPDFKFIENKFNLIIDNNKKMAVAEITDIRKIIKNENNEYARDINEKGREILKFEWERVKNGENVYKIIRRITYYGWLAMLIVLIFIGIYFSTLEPKKVTSNNAGDQSFSEDEIKSNMLKCWQLQNFKERIFKLNSCTGELIELRGIFDEKIK